MIFNKNLRKIALGGFLSASLLTFGCQQDNEMRLAETPQEAAVSVSSTNGAIIPGKYIVVFKHDVLAKNARLEGSSHEERLSAVRLQASQMMDKYGINDNKLSQSFGSSVLGFAASLSEEEVNQLKNDPAVDFIEPDRVVALGHLWFTNYFAQAGEELPYGIQKVGYGDGTGKTAWVIDTGVDLDHPDLNVDQRRSRSFVSGLSSPDDGNGHGTHVSGTIGAKKNGIGVVGVAYNATIVAVRVLDAQGSGSNSSVIAGVDYVAANGKPGDVANMSLGGGVSTALDNAVLKAANKGIKFALAAGNESTSATSSSPGRTNHSNIYTVSAMDSRNKFASFSNYGNPPVDYCAPGVNIKSTWKGGAYNTISGTSMATPHVAGLLALGSIRANGYVSGDPDGNADPIASK